MISRKWTKSRFLFSTKFIIACVIISQIKSCKIFIMQINKKKQENFSNIVKLTINSIIKKKKKIAINVCKNVILSRLNQIKIIKQKFNVVNKTPKLNREKLRKYVHKFKMIVLIHFENEISSSLFFSKFVSIVLEFWHWTKKIFMWFIFETKILTNISKCVRVVKRIAKSNETIRSHDH